MLQFGAQCGHTLEGLAGHRAEAGAGIGEFYATTFLFQQRHPERLLQVRELPADGTVGDMQLVGRAFQAAKTCHGLEGAQGIERW